MAEQSEAIIRQALTQPEALKKAFPASFKESYLHVISTSHQPQGNPRIKLHRASLSHFLRKWYNHSRSPRLVSTTTAKRPGNQSSNPDQAWLS